MSDSPSCAVFLGIAAAVVTLFVFFSGYSSFSELWTGKNNAPVIAPQPFDTGSESIESDAYSTVYVYRKYWHRFWTFDLYIDGVLAGDLKRGSFKRFQLKPGVHEFQVEDYKGSRLVIETLPKKTYYIRQEIGFWDPTPRGWPRLVLLSGALGSKEIEDL